MKDYACLLMITILSASSVFAANDATGASGKDGRLAVVLEQAAQGGGVACVADAGYTDTAFTLARNPKWAVHLLLPDADQVAKMRAKASAEGLLGRSLYVEAGAAESLPYPDHLLDLLIATPKTSKAEALRVISPIRGHAFVGGKEIVKPALPGSDWWTHRYHGPDNNQDSSDTAFQMPALQQYNAMPFCSALEGSMLVADGIRLEFYDWIVKEHRKLYCGQLVARSLYNGQIIWRRELPHRIKPDAPLMAVDAGRIYCASDEPGQVLVIELTTGKELPPIALSPETNRHVTWLAVENGRLYALLADRNWPKIGGMSSLFSSVWQRQEGNKESDLGEYEAKPELSAPTVIIPSSIVCWDVASKHQVWRHDDPAMVDFRTLGERGGKVYFFGEDKRLVCLGEDGKQLWENKDADWINTLDLGRAKIWITCRNTSAIQIGNGQLGFQLIVGGSKQTKSYFDCATGKFLWKGGGTFFHGDQLIQSFFDSGTAGVMDPKTGASVGKASSVGGWCGVRSWVPTLNGLLGHCSFGYKNPCVIPTPAAGGVLSFYPSVCTCMGVFPGAPGFLSAGDVLKTAEEKPVHPLETGATTAGALKEEAGDWPQYRGNVRHSGSSELSGAAILAIRATCSLDHPFPVPPGHFQYGWDWQERPTPPVTYGGLAFYGLSTGRVRAVRIADGQEAWSFETGGMVLTAPAVADGRVYVGSCDGWVYCLDAATGNLVWRWRGAPLDRRMMVFGKLTSFWPVISVLADGGTLYGVAGMFNANGRVMFALDAATGKVRWARWNRLFKIPGESVEEGNIGYIALVGKNLSSERFSDLPSIIDAATGDKPKDDDDLKITAISLPNLCQQDSIVASEKLLIRGGNMLFVNPDMRGYSGSERYSFYDTTKLVQKDNVKWASSLPSPAVTATEGVFVGGGLNRISPSTGTLSFWPLKDLNARKGGSPVDPKKAVWAQLNVDVNAVVLCKDAVVATIGDYKPNHNLKYGEFPEFAGWRMVAYNRADGKPLWSVNLPGEPMINGLAPSADGAWVITMRDGGLVVMAPGKGDAQ